MIQVAPQMRILVAVEPVDFRKGIDGLAGLCKDVLKPIFYSSKSYLFLVARFIFRGLSFGTTFSAPPHTGGLGGRVTLTVELPAPTPRRPPGGPYRHRRVQSCESRSSCRRSPR